MTMKPQTSLVQVAILTMAGKPWMRTWFSDTITHRWAWVADNMAHEFDCDYAEVDILEDDELGDVITVRGKPVGLLLSHPVDGHSRGQCGARGERRPAAVDGVAVDTPFKVVQPAL